MSRRLAAAVAFAATLGAGPAAGARAKGGARASDPCGSEGPADGPGSLDPFRPPRLDAVELNAAGKIPYRQGQWDEARAKYVAAEAADPEFLAPKLNVACSFVRQERFAEATAEVVALLDHAYVPWSREILEAADLGALKVRPEMKEIERARAASAARWSEGLPGSVLFVARKGTPLRVPEGPGVFILNPHEEVWAFTPRTRRYRQLTAEDGHVVALARAPGGTSIVYVTAEKLVRAARPGGFDVTLRGVALHELSLATMAARAPVSIPGDVRKLVVGTGGAADGALVFDVSGDETKGAHVLSPAGALAPAPPGVHVTEPLVVLTGSGVGPSKKGAAPLGAAKCESRLVEEGEGEARHLMYRPPGGAAFSLAPRAGAARSGLPIP